MKIQHISSNGDGPVNEDVLLLDDPIFVVADGATSKNKYIDQQGRTGGLIAATIACDTFKGNDEPLLDIAIKANQNLLAAMQEEDIDTLEPKNIWKASFVAVKVIGNEFEWVQVGDCSIVVIMKDGSHQQLGSTVDYDVEPLLTWKSLADEGVEDIGSVFNDHYTDTRDIINVELSVMNGDPRMNSLVKSGKQSLKGVHDIVMYTDGLEVPKTQPDAPADIDRFIKLYSDGGLHEVQRYVRELESGDADCRIYPRFKQHDDIAAVSLSFSD